ncbi:hypothetical protein LEMLEM_LOCUS145, partial [Lemmus lemmus]
PTRRRETSSLLLAGFLNTKNKVQALKSHKVEGRTGQLLCAAGIACHKETCPGTRFQLEKGVAKSKHLLGPNREDENTRPAWE